MEKSTANRYDGGNEPMSVDRAWLDFLRDQFPKGSRIRSWELDDPEHISIGTLEQIDEEGRFHTRLEDGSICLPTTPPRSSRSRQIKPLTPGSGSSRRPCWGSRKSTAKTPSSRG